LSSIFSKDNRRKFGSVSYPVSNEFESQARVLMPSAEVVVEKQVKHLNMHPSN
jgi:hypothetical protein